MELSGNKLCQSVGTLMKQIWFSNIWHAIFDITIDGWQYI